jgi:hypothetical protein
MRTPIRRAFPLLVLLLATVSACSARTDGPRSTRGSMDRISFEELRDTRASTALEVVQALRPQWLRQRAPTSFSSPSEPVVYLDNVPLGGLATLGTISAASVDHLQRISATAATQRWGTNHAGGVIFVGTRTGR